jgi:hypothetical protein
LYGERRQQLLRDKMQKHQLKQQQHHQQQQQQQHVVTDASISGCVGSNPTVYILINAEAAADEWLR